MDPVVNAALNSWAWNSRVIALFLLTAGVYLRGWSRGRRLVKNADDGQRLAAFIFGLVLLFLATESPLDAFDSLFLSAHMMQHLLLMVLAPPLVLLGKPTLPFLRGLPKKLVKDGLGPFLAWRKLKRCAAFLVWPPFAWSAFIVSTIVWHLPACYEAALQSGFWHEVQHASFFWTGILFWWPIVEPTSSKRAWPLWSKIPYLLFADILNTALSAFFVFSGRLLYPSYSNGRLGSFSAQDDQTVAGLIMWVPGSLVYLLPALVIAMRVLSGRTSHAGPTFARVPRRGAAKRSFNWRLLVPWRRVLQFTMLALAIAIVADGWFGPPVTPLNMAGILPWIHWRALSIVALLTVGNAFCMSCPFTLLRDMARRVLPARLRWPRRLRNKWIPTALLLLYFWCYEAFDLWDSPFVTAWIIVGYFTGAVLIDGIFRGASFCKYVCPIGQFHFVSSLISPREVAIKQKATCQSCSTFDCIRGNEKARGCELNLFQPKKAGNLDCTFCLDCIRACPHDNVGIFPVLPGETIVEDPYRSSLGRLSKRTDLAALALVFIFGSFANAAGMVTPVTLIEQAWNERLGPGALPWIVAALGFITVVLLPVLLVAACAVLNSLLGSMQTRVTDLARRLVFTLIPLGVTMWAAHLLYHFATGWSSLWPLFAHRFLAQQGQFQMPSIPAWLTSGQLLLLDAGLLLTLYLGWQVCQRVAGGVRKGAAYLAPWGLLAITLYSAGAWIFFQPMQMRGMMH